MKLALFFMGITLLYACSDKTGDTMETDPTIKTHLDTTKTVAESPDTIIALKYYNNGNTKKKSNDFKGAIADYSKAIEINPKYSQAYNNRGSAYGSLSDFKTALSDFNNAVKFDSLNVDAFFNRGLVKAKLNDVRGALKDFNRAIDLNPAAGNYYAKRGIAKSILGDKEGSCDDFRKGATAGNEESESYKKQFCK
ncbi:MAG: tetratricopeptide repeat protein [Ginsengibacter sp.]